MYYGHPSDVYTAQCTVYIHYIATWTMRDERPEQPKCVYIIMTGPLGAIEYIREKWPARTANLSAGGRRRSLPHYK